MPNRNLQGDYRYAYQGQEVDPETGKEAFELRLWDSRIGRWLTTDPYGQFNSPYLGMHNNPISAIDPDGGFSWLGAQWFKLWHGGEVSKVDGKYGSYYKVTGFGDEGASIAVGRGDIPTREGWLAAARERLSDQIFWEQQGLELTFHENRFVALGHMTSPAAPTARFNGLLNATTSTFNKAFKFKIANATEQQLGALNHAIRRHGDELAELIGKPIKWTKQKNLQPVLDNFNDAVSIIAKHGKKVGTKVVAFGIKGSGQNNARTLVNVHEYVHNNKTYYLFTRAKDDLFVSAGLKTR